jgi:hypothetical protein
MRVVAIPMPSLVSNLDVLLQGWTTLATSVSMRVQLATMMPSLATNLVLLLKVWTIMAVS